MTNYQCNTCKGFSDNLTEYWFPFLTTDDVYAWYLCPKCHSRQVKPPMTKDEALVSIVTRKLTGDDSACRITNVELI